MLRSLGVIFSLFVSTLARAEDWPQFLGPRRDGTSRESVKPWTGEPKVLWRTPVGEGHSSPIVAGGLVYLLDRVADKNAERLTIFSADGGKPLASTEYPREEFKSLFGTGPRATPVVASDRVYTFGVTGHVTANSVTRDGENVILKPLFTTDPLADFKAKNLMFGVAATPLVEGDLLVLLVGGKDTGAGVVAYDRRSGKVTWQALDAAASYASPIAIGAGPTRQIIVLTQKGLASLAPKDGSVNWQFPFEDKLSESSTTPIRVGDMLYASSVTLGSVALKLTEKNGKPAVEKIWEQKELTCYFSTPAPVGKDYLYMVTGAATLVNPSVTLRCVEAATGRTLWSKPNAGRYHAALIRTGDDKLLMLDDTGRLTLIDPDPKEYKQLAQSKVCGQTWAHPALSNGRLYLRDAKELMCLEMAK